MGIKQIIALYQGVIASLIKEVDGYSSDANLWKVADGINNSGGNLCLHLIGNLNHFIGATEGHTGYVRNRDAEFSMKGLSKSELMHQLSESAKMVEEVLGKLTEDQLNETFPFDFAGKESTRYYLLFFYGHFQYHLGQVNYHRRLLA